ncbi:DUF4054 domain-containing protein [Campylobacter sp.]|uniref:DUF4054 domain-containing protein n=1 Tax=Campylobacter sp. TaxID=205 RepID=UPI0025BFF792|nr:DUF4054 domain-containing protein [Campylobacter sp.]
MVKVGKDKIIKIALSKKDVNKLFLNKYKLFYFFSYPTLLQDFLNNFQEFKPLFSTEESINFFLTIVEQVKCDFLEYKNLDLEKKYELRHFLLLIAHYLVLSGFSKSINILPSDGLIASSAVGDVNISYQASPYSSKGNEFTYWMSLTPYGKMYLAWLSRQAGLTIVN